jgi:DNA-binding NarL/FixJ family response regulator
MSAERVTVLVVDDHAPLRALVRDLLEQAGYAVAEAATGTAAIEFLDGPRPAVILLDVNLPGLNGYEVCRRIRDRFNGNIGIIFISGERVETFDRSAGLLVGGDDYLTKPFDPSELVARVRRLAPVTAPYKLAAAAAADQLANLTPREREVVLLLADGLDQHEIAERLFISPKTVATHIQHVLGKLDVRNRAQAVSLVLHDSVRESRRLLRTE